MFSLAKVLGVPLHVHPMWLRYPGDTSSLRLRDAVSKPRAGPLPPICAPGYGPINPARRRRLSHNFWASQPPRPTRQGARAAGTCL